jgi:hypothetical protein
MCQLGLIVFLLIRLLYQSARIFTSSRQRGASEGSKKMRNMKVRSIIIILLLQSLTSQAYYRPFLLENVFSRADDTSGLYKNYLGICLSNNGTPTIVPIEINRTFSSKGYYMILVNSGYKVKEFKFCKEDLYSAIIFSDTSYTSEGKVNYINFSLKIKSSYSKKLIVVHFKTTKDRSYIYLIYQTIKGDKLHEHQDIDELKFDYDGNLILKQRIYFH